MEPLSEQELNQLLRQWKAPDAPSSLDRKVLPRRASWRWIFSGSIRIPVPAVAAILVALALWAFLRTTPPPAQTQGSPVSLTDFQPVKQLEPKVVGRANENN
jgi:hypothetical protein